MAGRETRLEVLRKKGRNEGSNGGEMLPRPRAISCRVALHFFYQGLSVTLIRAFPRWNQTNNAVYWVRLKGSYMVARIFFLLLLNCSAWPCLGPA